MPTCNIIKMKHLTPLHISTGKENQYDFAANALHSDTLSAALASLRAQQGRADDVATFLNAFTISSAFPFFETTCFLPKLQGKINVKVVGREEQSFQKQLKRLRYIALPLWRQLAQGQEVTVEATQLIDDYLLEANADFVKPYRSQVVQRVNVPRADNTNANPFFFNWTYFHEKAGLYCMTDAQDEQFDELLSLFKLLGETGLGADRNNGGGMFEVESDRIELPDIEDNNHCALLSLYLPLEEELALLNLQSARYELILRGGFMAGSSEESLRHLRKRSIYMFNVGSVFPTTEPLTGKIVDLAPAWNDERMHPVYRSGRPFYLPVKINDV